MPQTFNPCLINDPSDDPGVFVAFSFQNRAIAFDLGDIHALSSRDILKISHVFISHTHMDHFAGFDRLLRLCLGREKTLHLFGPAGFLKNIEGKLGAYTWNLVKNYTSQLILNATEIHPDVLYQQTYACKNGFRPDGPPLETSRPTPFRAAQPVYKESGLAVSTEILDHGIPCLGFCLKEAFRINIRKDALDRMGLSPGPWLHRFKQAIYTGRTSAPLAEVLLDENITTALKNYRFDDLKSRLAIITAGQKIGYIADVAGTQENIEKIVPLIQDADHLFIEAAFLDQDKLHAAAKHHLTARQAGRIAGRAGVKRFTLFHFSPRYNDDEKTRFYQEAQGAYDHVIMPVPELREIPDA